MQKDIYEVEEKINYIIENNTDENGVLSDEVSDQFEELNLERVDLIKQLALSVKNTVAFANSIDLEIKALQQKKLYANNRAERLRYWVQQNIKEGEKFKESNFTIGWRKSSTVNTEFANPKELLRDDNFDKFVTVTTTYNIDKKLVKEAVKNKEAIPSGITIENKNTMSIK